MRVQLGCGAVLAVVVLVVAVVLVALVALGQVVNAALGLGG